MKATLIALLGSVMGVAMLLGIASAQLPDTIAAPGETTVTTLHAEGAQVYECKADAAGKLAWQFREPVATLLLEGKTLGRHYAGPTWELADGSVVIGKVVGRASAPSAEGHPVAQARGLRATGHRDAVRRDDRPAHQHAGRCGRGGLRSRR